MDSTLSLNCSTCLKPCVDGQYYFKDGKATCISCAVAAIPVPEAKALAHDAERKKAERMPQAQGTPLTEATKLCAELEVEARRVALSFVREAAKVVTTDPQNCPRGTMDSAERLIKMAERLDLMADKLFARRD